MGHETDQDFIERFSGHFLNGYSQENRLDPSWLAEIPHFLKLREIDLYAQIHFAFGRFENVADPWCQNYLRGRKRKIEENIPYIAFDWTSLSEIPRP
jgi:Ser/Thr protein kinase RdoA (MazF antagonist)